LQLEKKFQKLLKQKKETGDRSFGLVKGVKNLQLDSICRECLGFTWELQAQEAGV